MSSVRIRPLQAVDLAPADTVLMRAFATGESFGATIDRHYAIQPDGWLVAESADEVVGVVAGVRFGSLAYVGMMGVDPKCQGRGVGQRLLEVLIGDLDRHGCKTLLLDATPVGERLYRRVGFVDDGVTLDLRRSPGSSPSNPQVTIDLDRVADLDREAFGSDRKAALMQLLSEPNARATSIDGDGYVIGQSRVIGPLVARNVEIAERLLGRVISGSADRMMTPSENAPAVSLVRRYRFEIQREVKHMRLGPAIQRNRSLVYGQASFALG